MRVSVELVERTVDGVFEALDIAEKVVVGCGALEIAPQPFDGVELGAVDR